MTEQEQPQIYLITPTQIDLTTFPDQLAKILDAHPIACLRLDLASQDEDLIARSADQLRETAHARDVPMVIGDHMLLAERLGLDGVHLNDAARSVRAARTALGADAIVGSFCAASRHDGITAGESGADYISFGPVGDTLLHDGSRAEADLFRWWSEMIELPVVAEGGLTPDLIATLAAHTDFFGIGAEIWNLDDPLAALHALTAPLGQDKTAG